MAATTRFPLDVDAFLNPIAPEAPAGLYLRFNDSKDKQVMASVKLFRELEEYRLQDEDAKSKGEYVKSDAKKADWPRVAETAVTLLQGHTKDLQVAAWLVEALGRLDGVAGIRSGIVLLKAIADRFWDTIHPFDEDPEERIELRTGVFEWLDSPALLPLMILKEPIVQVPRAPTILHSCLDEKQILDFEEVCRRRKSDDSPTREELEQQWVADGKIRIDTFQNYVKATPREFYEGLRDDLSACREAIERLNECLAAEDRFGDDAVPLMNSLQSLQTCRERVERILRGKAGETPDPPNQVEGPADEAPSDESAWDDGTSADVEPEAEADTDEGSAPAAPAPRRAARSRGGPIADADDAALRVAEAAAFLRQNDPGDPAAYLVLAALRMGESYRPGGWTDGGSAPAPPTEARQALRRLTREGDWDATLAEADRSLARPDGQGWLDAHRLAIQALTEQGHGPASRAARALLGGWLADQPDWPGQELDDGTPAANPESQSWAADLVRPAAQPVPAPPPLPEPPPTMPQGREADGEEKPIDPWDQARELVGQGRVVEAINLLARAARTAASGRERFVRRLQQAQICVNGRRIELALPLFEELVRLIDAHRLEDWEESSLCGQVLAGLYQCLKTNQPDRANAVYARLCQLDMSLALACGPE